MKKRLIVLYFFAITIPLFLAITATQSARYAALEREVRRIEREQETWIENNKRLMAAAALLASPSRIERIAREELGMTKMRPENVTQIRIDPQRRRL